MGSLLAALCLHGLVIAALLYVPASKPPVIDLRMPMLSLRNVTIVADEPQDADPSAPTASIALVPETPAVPIPEIEEVEKEAEKPAKEPVPEPEKTPEPKLEPKPEKTPEQLLAEALSDAKHAAKPEPLDKYGSSALAAALAEAKTDTSKSGRSGAGTGEYVAGTYREYVESRIRERFTTPPRSDGKAFELRVLLDIAKDGTVTKVTILMPSGNSNFDSNVLRAIREAGKMPPPPNESLERLEILFNSNMNARQRRM
jgi:TonB family protein